MKISSITFTRFLAAMSVVIFHYGRDLESINFRLWNLILEFGNRSVSYFFLLSGFILVFVYYPKLSNNAREIRNFYLLRLGRIYPIYILALAMLAFLLVYFHQSKIQFSNVTLNFFLIQAWFKGKELTLNFPGWSLSVEFFFYLIFPFLLFWLKPKRSTLVYVSVVACWLINQIIFIVNFTPDDSQLIYNPVMHLGTFIMGMGGGIYFIRNFHSLNNLKDSFKFGLLLISTVTLIGISLFSSKIMLYTHNGLLSPLILVFIISLSLDRLSIGRVFAHPFLQYLGDISYGIYILQFPARIISSYLNDLLVLPFWSTGKFYYYIGILVSLSIFTYEFVEKPIRNSVKHRYIKW